MGEATVRAPAPDLLPYRPWRGTFRSSWSAVWPIARISLAMIFRRKLFWALYALGLMIFLLFFFGNYMLAWGEAMADAGQGEVRAGLLGRLKPSDLIKVLRVNLMINGTGQTYRNLFWYQGYIVTIVLALAGSVLIGNDIRFGSLPYYLSKPLSRWHYLLGKGLALAVFINMMTTLPALVLFVQYGFLEMEENYWVGRGTIVGTEDMHLWLPVNQLVFGILGYGLVLTVVMSVLLLATATWVRKTVPLIMTWAVPFLFCRMVANVMVEGLRYNEHWKLIDLWNCIYLVGNACLGMPTPARNPSPWWAAAVLVGVTSLCLSYLVVRIRGVEIIG